MARDYLRNFGTWLKRNQTMSDVVVLGLFTLVLLTNLFVDVLRSVLPLVLLLYVSINILLAFYTDKSQMPADRALFKFGSYAHAVSALTIFQVVTGNYFYFMYYTSIVSLLVYIFLLLIKIIIRKSTVLNSYDVIRTLVVLTFVLLSIILARREYL